MTKPLPQIQKTLRNELDKAERLVVLAVGSSLRGDDAAGQLVGEYLLKKIDSPELQKRILVLFGDTAPENLSGQIRQFAPSHVLVIDAIDCGQQPGAAIIYHIDEPVYNASCSTHGLPLRIMMEYLMAEIGCRVVILGLQIGSREVAAPPSKVIRSAARKIAAMLNQLLPLCLHLTGE